MKVICKLCALGIAAAALGSGLTAASSETNTAADLAKSRGDTKQSDTKGWVRRTDPVMAKWREDRFGIMIHWGIYSVPGGWWNGKEVKGAAEWIKAFAKIPKADYDALVPQFNPTNYDPVAWAKSFKAAGAKYVVITTKHHDGFCLWDSKFTDYDIASTPYKKDLLKPLADAVRAEGLDIGFYYSIIDWHHPDYRAVIKSPAEEAAYARYLEYMKNQLKELLTEFGPVTTLWFDGRWDPSYKTRPEIGRDLEAYCRRLSPGLVLGDRVRAYDAMADYNSGFERRLPQTQPPTDWESCMTMTENSWGYHRTWSGNGWKTPQYLCELLTRCAAMNGNFLVNIGPKPDGTIRDEEVARLSRIGDWLKLNGAAIYGTEPFPIEGLPDGIYSTRQGKHGYLIAFRWPETDKLKLKGISIAAASLLTPGGPLPVALENGDTLVGLPAQTPAAIAAVIALELKN
jgi:alpha-L-fucosidase